ncbi:hypothetical protein BTJ40_17575 [Microbulbifer sp. A4B17]|uniref:hypothetical protein n=1 Tax=Microbulbifer sp. A4B17 TaxID=359370 RepID=UPI000D52EA17|nr:hypothetical protein [Microbulbifer sp. A4B17]AWF82480.1 hypothetical protein BTJ40_17575 [Microbulbifer sp. A4B17]
MPTFAYQSINSNASANCGVGASNSQYFTRMAHNHQASDQDRWHLVMPTAAGLKPQIPIHGPAQLVAQAPMGYMGKNQHSNAQFLSMIEGKARQTHQHLYRSLGQACDFLVYGEMDGSNSEWNSMQHHAGSLVGSNTTGKACNSFSIHAANTAQHTILGSGMGWTAVRTGNVNAVFVHVPNSIAKKQDDAISFYRSINNHLIHAGYGAIDLVMGDTNQGTDSFTADVLSKATGTTFSDAHSEASIHPSDSYHRSFSGTNSTASKKYDVAIYNTKTIHVNKVDYLSQSTPVTVNGESASAAVTDHMGIFIDVSK